jgi:hypothetical protein
VAGGDLYVAKVHAGVEHGGDEGVPEHVRVHPRQVHASGVGAADRRWEGDEDDPVLEVRLCVSFCVCPRWTTTSVA